MEKRLLIAESVCNENIASLKKMEENLISGIQEGLTDICRNIASEDTAKGTAERDSLEKLAQANEALTESIAMVFKKHLATMRFIFKASPDKRLEILPEIQDIRRFSTASCASIFEEMDSALSFSLAFADNLNPLQQRLLEQYIGISKTFARNMLAADGDLDALSEVLGIPKAR